MSNTSTPPLCIDWTYFEGSSVLDTGVDAFQVTRAAGLLVSQDKKNVGSGDYHDNSSNALNEKNPNSRLQTDTCVIQGICLLILTLFYDGDQVDSLKFTPFEQEKETGRDITTSSLNPIQQQQKRKQQSASISLNGEEDTSLFFALKAVLSHTDSSMDGKSGGVYHTAGHHNYLDVIFSSSLSSFSSALLMDGDLLKWLRDEGMISGMVLPGVRTTTEYQQHIDDNDDDEI